VTVTPDGVISVSIDYAYEPVIGEVFPAFGFGEDIETAAISMNPKSVMRAL
jgi:hypothetical protein